MILISPYKHTVTRNFPSPRNSAVLIPKTFEFVHGKEVDVPDEFAKALESTHPDRYYAKEEWKVYLETELANSALLAPEVGKRLPTLDELKAKDLATLKVIADDLEVPYSQNVDGKSLATTIYNLIKIKTTVVGGDEAAKPKDDDGLELDSSIDYDSMKVQELKELLDDAGIEYKANLTKAELIVLLKEGQPSEQE